ncbi:signal recognition particle-docking protein FtsY [Micropruina sonneratiae]|uniref:signal recognition particle-docking protein FtsY n=1 Tax=Micropruina sonneratiae TaxID=2986940 RepID=UPI0022273FA0|nr:signal recognition particle-docking protein FtsY [Micropruina sp. KQZ13P-5]MCW3157346.1 signal recognition particle-docking protein FtsY [Micropruina sp. KQZ13P-5]
MDLLQLLIIGVLGFAIVVAGTIFLARRRMLPPSEPRRQLPEEPAPSEPAGEPAADQPAASAPATPTLERPEAPTTRMARLRRRLAGSNNPLARGLLSILSSDRLDAEVWDDFEATLITSDLGVGPTQELVDALRSELAIEGVGDAGRARDVLRRELLQLVNPDFDRTLAVDGADGKPGVVLVVGVNGTGKTTTIGKLARVLVAEGKSVVLGAADTFRAAAADQLQTWGDRVGVPTVRGPEGGDPAAVAYQAVQRGLDEGADVVVVDTAGRLHTKTGLMDELGKIKRVIEKLAPVTEVLLLIDATTGQNGLIQARVFAEVVQITGIVLSKLDGSAKGGIVVQVQRELGVPVKLIGLGEGVDDLVPFDAAEFVDALLTD